MGGEMGYGAGDGNEAPMMPRERNHAMAAKKLAEPREASPLERVSGVMEKELHVLAEMVDRLAGRLAPLSTERPGPQTKADPDDPPPGASPHVVWLHSQANSVRAVRAILRELSDRLEV